MSRAQWFDGTHTHASGALGDGLVLCGDSLDGENGDAHMHESRALVDCPRCVLVIVHAKQWRFSDLTGVRQR